MVGRQGADAKAERRNVFSPQASDILTADDADDAEHAENLKTGSAERCHIIFQRFSIGLNSTEAQFVSAHSAHSAVLTIGSPEHRAPSPSVHGASISSFAVLIFQFN